LANAPTILAAESSATPRCPHFGVCGGCQHQDLAYTEQLRLKRARLEDLLRQAYIDAPPDIPTHSAEPYGYRNRIRLRVEEIDAQLRLGYNLPATTHFLPITTCPIAAPALWDTAQALLAAAAHDRDAAFWLAAAGEVELFCNHDQTQLQITLFCAPRTKVPRTKVPPNPRGQPGSPASSVSFARAFAAFQSHAPRCITLAGAGAIASDPRTGPTGRTLAAAGAPGLAYSVAVPGQPPNNPETYWITRGGFFQVNRFLVETLLTLVCFEASSTARSDAALQPRRGLLAWDLYAGVGLFSRVLARSFARVTAVEANPTAAADLRRSLQKVNAPLSNLSPQHTAIEATTLDFLRTAILNRDRPDLIVLDPPRAGASLEVCALLARIAAPTVVYVSCDPTTLARDLAALTPHYRLSALHLVDLFPQTSHLETVAILHRHAQGVPK
jgi:23S rRNA (uracil1939-C5)-methyltransferase